MVTKYGMSEKLGAVLYGSDHGSDEVFLGRDFSSTKNYSEATAAEIDNEIRSIINSAYEKCTVILTEHGDKLEKLAEYLLKVETVDGDQFKALMEGDPTFEELDAIAEAKKRKSDEENEARRKRDEEDRKKREEEEAKKNAEMHNRNVNGVDAFGQYEAHENNGKPSDNDGDNN
jgi:cell division protease FtsH